MKKPKITIVGAGLVGSLFSCLLAKRGYTVNVYERRPDMRKVNISAGKSINLAMSVRGWTALERAGLKETMEPLAIPMYARMIHQVDGTTDVQAYLNLARHAAAMKEAEDMTTKKRIYSQVGGGEYVLNCGTELIPNFYIIPSSFVFRVSIRLRLHYSH